MSWLQRRFARRVTPVEHLDRSQKARTIEAILTFGTGRPMRGLRVLDVGCGNGGIARHFAKYNRVTGVDVADRRRGACDDFGFIQVDSESLPFADGSFDIVLSHHVIEHVADQVAHLREIGRVLASDGACYLATPNRSSPFMRGHVGNTQVLHHAQMAPLFESMGFEVLEVSSDVVAFPERFEYPVRLGRLLPRAVANKLGRLFPAHMFVLWPKRRRRTVSAAS